MHHAVSAQSHDFFFFNDTATTEIYTLSLHDALPISRNFDFARTREARDRLYIVRSGGASTGQFPVQGGRFEENWNSALRDRKSTRLNSSHSQISYAVFCLKKKKHTEYH